MRSHHIIQGRTKRVVYIVLILGFKAKSPIGEPYISGASGGESVPPICGLRHAQGRQVSHLDSLGVRRKGNTLPAAGLWKSPVVL